MFPAAIDRTFPTPTAGLWLALHLINLNLKTPLAGIVMYTYSELAKMRPKGNKIELVAQFFGTSKR